MLGREREELRDDVEFARPPIAALHGRGIPHVGRELADAVRQRSPRRAAIEHGHVVAERDGARARSPR